MPFYNVTMTVKDRSITERFSLVTETPNDHAKAHFVRDMHVSLFGKQALGYGRKLELSFHTDKSYMFQIISRTGKIVMSGVIEFELDAPAAKFAIEFPDYPAADLPIVPQGFEDVSWHNDMSPSFARADMGLTVFVDYADATKREFPDGKRFILSHETDNEDCPTLTTLAYSDDWRDVQKVIMARLFAETLKNWIGPSDFETMRRDNAPHRYDHDICVSHDYCDSNMAMHAAWLEVMKRDVDMESQDDADLWNAAWCYAKESGLIAGDEIDAIEAGREDDFEPIANVLEPLARDLPETISLEDVQRHPALARIVLECDAIANKVDMRALDWIKSQG